MTEPASEPVTLQLDGFDSHGTTRARLGRRSIEVEHGIAGETVRAEIVGRRRLRGRILEVLEPSPYRVAPPCPYFREWHCGGCQWQQISYQGQLALKRAGVDEEMRGAGLSLAVSAVHTLNDPWRYRSTAGIALGKRAGFRRQGSLAIVPIRDCPISVPIIGRLMAALNDLIESGALPDFHGRVRLDVLVSGSAGEERLQTLVHPTEEGVDASDLEILVAALRGMEEVGSIALRRLDGTVEPLQGELFTTTQVAGRPVVASAASFFQTNLLLLPRLIARIEREAQPLAGKRVADVYAGVGIFGLFLAEQAGEVVEIESDPLAVEATRATAARWGLSNVEFMAAPAEEGLAASGPFDTVVVDPPRAGLSRPVIEALIAARPPQILYVSCLAQSLARDLAQLIPAGYGVEHLELFDFYPQTYHVELFAALRREDDAA